MSGAFDSLSIPNFRIWFASSLITNTAVWASTTAQSWIVLTQLTNNDATAVGIVITLQFGPTFLLAGATGWAADRFSRRRLLLATQSAMAVLSLAMAILLLTGLASLPLMYLFAGCVGIVAAVDQPARQTIVADLVSAERATNAVALNMASFNIGRMLGPAAAGLAIASVDAGWVFVANLVLFAATSAALFFMRADQLTEHPKPTESVRMLDGVRYIARRPDLLIAILTVFPVSIFAMNFSLVASTMAVHFARGSDAFGILSTCLAVGAIVGALASASRATPRLPVVIGSTFAFIAATAIAAVMPNYWAHAAALVAIGFCVTTVFATANAYLQTSTTLALRGRVLAIYLAVVMVAGPVTSPGLGWIANHLGAPAVLLAIAAAGALLAGPAALWERSQRRGLLR